MPQKPKPVTLKKTARTYRKSHTKPKVDERGAHMFDSQGDTYSRGSSTSTLKYKPKPRAATYGTNSPSGGGTLRVRKARSK